MSFAKKSWELARAIESGQSTFKQNGAQLFSDFDKEFSNPRERLLALGYVMHYVTHLEDPNSDIYVKRILDHVSGEPSDWSKGLVAASENANVRRVKAAIEERLSSVRDGVTDLQSITGEFVHAISQMDSDRDQSLVLRCFETMTQSNDYDNDCAI